MDATMLLMLLVAGGAAVLAETRNRTHQATRPQVARASLNVGRSLDPDSMQTLEVRTKDGGVATLLVKKRDGKSGRMPGPVSVRSTQLHLVDRAEPNKHVSIGDGGWKAVADVDKGVKSVASSSLLLPKDAAATKEKHDKDKAKSLWVPDPVYVRSSPMYVKGEQQYPWKRQRSLMTVDSDGTPVITGVRMPDDVSDVFTWRNARVINNNLVPNDSEASPATRPAETHKKVVVKKNLGNAPPKDIAGEEFQPVAVSRPVSPKNYRTLSSESYSRILEYINTVNQRESRQREAEMRGRMIHYPMPRYNFNGAATPAVVANSRFQPRMLQLQGSTVYPTSLLYAPKNANPSRVSFEEGVRTPVLQYAHPELGVQTAKIERKQDDDVVVEETRLQKVEAVGETKPDPLAMAYFSQDIHSDRSPYAYEPGLLSYDDKYESKDSTYDKRSNSEDTKKYQQWPKSPLALLNQEDSYGLRNEKYIRRYPYNGYSDSYYGKDSTNTLKGPMITKLHQYGGPNRYSTMYAHVEDERPFWEKLGETIREHVQSSMDKVSDLTRPVVEPLVEATHKISQNLGLAMQPAGQGNTAVIQDKVGGAVAAYPVLLPALGLVAGGAALGLGAVAVGRYLDVDIMKRGAEGQEEEDDEDLAMEHKRALDSIVKQLNEREPSSRGKWVVTRNPEDEDPSEVGSRAKDVGESARASIHQDRKNKRSSEDRVIYVIEEDARRQENVGEHHLSKRSAPEESNNNLLTTVEPSTTEEAVVTMAGLGHPDHWKDTSCAKKIFCEVMVRQPADSLVLMEKKMALLSSLVGASDEVGQHLGQVMAAVRRGDCALFRCDGASPR